MRIRFILIFTVIIAVFQILFADKWVVPEERIFFSENREYYFVVKPAIQENENCIGELYAIAEVMLYTDIGEFLLTDSFLIWKNTLENELSSVCVSNDGKHVITINTWVRLGYGENVVVIYDITGTVIKKYSLNNILSEVQISISPFTISSIWWSGNHYIDNENNILVLQVVKSLKIPHNEDLEYNNIWISLDNYEVIL